VCGPTAHLSRSIRKLNRTRAILIPPQTTSLPQNTENKPPHYTYTAQHVNHCTNVSTIMAYVGHVATQRTNFSQPVFKLRSRAPHPAEHHRAYRPAHPHSAVYTAYPGPHKIPHSAVRHSAYRCGHSTRNRPKSRSPVCAPPYNPIKLRPPNCAVAKLRLYRSG